MSNTKKTKKIEELYEKAVKTTQFTSFVNLTDKDPEACKILVNLGIIKDLLKIIEGQLAQGVYSKLMNTAVDVLYNLSKIDGWDFFTFFAFFLGFFLYLFHYPFF